MTRKETGGCLCGAVRYEFTRGQALSAHDCHCKDCQKCTGSGKATIVLLPTDALELHGALRTFTVTGSAGSHVTRAFCPDCGSPIISYVEEDPSMRFVKAGSLDDSGWVTVKSGFWRDTAVPWSPVNESVTCAAGNPEGAL